MHRSSCFVAAIDRPLTLFLSRGTAQFSQWDLANQTGPAVDIRNGWANFNWWRRRRRSRYRAGCHFGNFFRLLFAFNASAVWRCGRFGGSAFSPSWTIYFHVNVFERSALVSICVRFRIHVQFGWTEIVLISRPRLAFAASTGHRSVATSAGTTAGTAAAATPAAVAATPTSATRIEEDSAGHSGRRSGHFDSGSQFRWTLRMGVGFARSSGRSNCNR